MWKVKREDVHCVNRMIDRLPVNSFAHEDTWEIACAKKDFSRIHEESARISYIQLWETDVHKWLYK